MAQVPNRFPKNDIMALTDSQPRYDLAESIGPDLLLGDLLRPQNGLDDLTLSYGTAAGDPALRQVLAALHGTTPEDVVVTVGGMHALFLISFILCRPGDEVVAMTPLFPNARKALVAVGAEVRDLPVSFDSGYRLDFDALRARLSPRTKLVSLASPQNPSGVAIPEETLQAVLDLMAGVCPEAFLLVDETYRDAVYGDEQPASSAVALNPRVISCASLSKCHGAPGLRLGWAITRDPALREQLLRGKFVTVIACSRADEALALRVLQQREAISGERRVQLRDGLAQTAAWVDEQSAFVDWVRPDAGALCCVRLKPAVFDDAAVARFYDSLARHDVRVAPGSWFGEAERVFRLGFGFLPMDALAAGLTALTNSLQDALKEAA